MPVNGHAKRPSGIARLKWTVDWEPLYGNKDAHSGQFYKIGRSNSAGRREYELAIQLPEKAKMIHTIRTDDPAGIQAYWHKRFEIKRRNGEWFKLDAADIAAFKRRRFMCSPLPNP
jgi:hypothetical protein